jgi:ADP-ribose pyrophosphatase
MSDTWDEGGNPWIVKGVTQAFANDWFRIDEHDVIRPDGAKGYYGVIRVRRLAVGVLPIDAEGCVHLVGQWRFPLGRYSWEMPEGGAEPGEDARGCAERELAEETGLRAREWDADFGDGSLQLSHRRAGGNLHRDGFVTWRGRS